MYGNVIKSTSGSMEESHCVFVSETRKIGQIKVPTQFYLMPVGKSTQLAHSGLFLGSDSNMDMERMPLETQRDSRLISECVLRCDDSTPHNMNLECHVPSQSLDDKVRLYLGRLCVLVLPDPISTRSLVFICIDRPFPSHTPSNSLDYKLDYKLFARLCPTFSPSQPLSRNSLSRPHMTISPSSPVSISPDYFPDPGTKVSRNHPPATTLRPLSLHLNFPRDLKPSQLEIDYCRHLQMPQTILSAAAADGQLNLLKSGAFSDINVI